MDYYLASILNLTEKWRLVYLNVLQCRRTTGQVNLFAQHCQRLHPIVFDATCSDSGDRRTMVSRSNAIPALCVSKHDIYLTELQKRQCNKVMFLQFQFLLRDADMHSVYLLRRRGWLAGWVGVNHTPVLYQNG